MTCKELKRGAVGKDYPPVLRARGVYFERPRRDWRSIIKGALAVVGTIVFLGLMGAGFIYALLSADY